MRPCLARLIRSGDGRRGRLATTSPDYYDPRKQTQFAGWTKEQRDERLARFIGFIRKTSASKKPEREEIELIFDQGVIGRERAIQAAYEGM